MPFASKYDFLYGIHGYYYFTDNKNTSYFISAGVKNSLLNKYQIYTYNAGWQYMDNEIDMGFSISGGSYSRVGEDEVTLPMLFIEVIF